MRKHHTRAISLVLGITAALVAIGMMAAVIDRNEGSAWAESKSKVVDRSCMGAYQNCADLCHAAFDSFEKGSVPNPSGGLSKCLGSCSGSKNDCNKVELQESKKPPTGTTVAPTKAGQNIGKAGGITKDPMKAPTDQPITGSGAVPKTKVGKVGGVQKVQEGWSTPSTSGGGTILMQRSKGKKQ